MMCGDLENIPADEKNATLFHAVGNVLFFDLLVVDKLQLHTILEILFVAELEGFSVF